MSGGICTGEKRPDPKPENERTAVNYSDPLSASSTRTTTATTTAINLDGLLYASDVAADADVTWSHAGCRCC